MGSSSFEFKHENSGGVNKIAMISSGSEYFAITWYFNSN